MRCVEGLLVPFVCCLRAFVHVCTCLFKHRPVVWPLHTQYEKSHCVRGGWYTDNTRGEVSTRDSFYTAMGLTWRSQTDAKARLSALCTRLSDHMLNSGQVPCAFRRTWFDAGAPIYVSDRLSTAVIDANLQYIILAWWLYSASDTLDQKQYLACQRAWEWVERYRLQDAILELEDASWETTRAGGGALLLTNVLATQAIRCMELLAIVRHDPHNADRFQKLHGRFLSKWVTEIYKTQQTLPKILAIAWGMVPKPFIDSFQEQIHQPWMPLWTDGPLNMKTTTHAWIYGQSDIHTTVVWPWVGFLWICVLVDHHKYDLAKTWWASYLEFHRPHTLYDMYTTDGKPIRRAFVRAKPAHTLTLGMQIAAKLSIDNIGHC